MLKVFAGGLLLSVMLLQAPQAPPGPSTAQMSDAQVRMQVERLAQLVSDLQRRVDALEKKAAPVTATPQRGR